MKRGRRSSRRWGGTARTRPSFSFSDCRILPRSTRPGGERRRVHDAHAKTLQQGASHVLYHLCGSRRTDAGADHPVLQGEKRLRPPPLQISKTPSSRSSKWRPRSVWAGHLWISSSWNHYGGAERGGKCVHGQVLDFRDGHARGPTSACSSTGVYGYCEEYPIAKGLEGYAGALPFLPGPVRS